jgi:hypothetical protein
MNTEDKIKTLPDECLTFLNEKGEAKIQLEEPALMISEIVFKNADELHVEKIMVRNKTLSAINLLSDCDGFPPFGILIYLPDFNTFASYDDDHKELYTFNTNSWTIVFSSLKEYINSPWYEEIKKKLKIKRV